MAAAIWKYELAASERQAIQMPRGAKPLCVAMQRDQACMWVEVDTKAPHESRMFGVFGTGHPLPVTTAYVGTLQMRGGDLIFHIYELPG